MSRRAGALWTLSALFLMRVVGQVLVAFAGVTWLPPASEWYSGLLPYSLLLPAQLVILALMLRINLQVSRGRGYLSARRLRLGRFLLVFAAVYAGVMAVRFGISAWLYPERGLLPPGVIPVAFHWVLAGYLALVGRAALEERRTAGAK